MPYKDPQKAVEAARRWRLANPEKRKEIVRKSARKHAAKKREYCREWALANPDKLLAYQRRTSAKNRNSINARKRSKWVGNPNHRIAELFRHRAYKILTGVNNSAETLRILGCASANEFRDHLEKLFLPGMTWANYGYYGWQLDHIKPCASFDLTDPRQLAICFHHTNFQPSWRLVNQSKGASIL